MTLKNALPQKMSEVLLDFAAPLLDAIDKSDKVVLESTIKTATFMWNYAVISSGQYPKILTKSLGRVRECISTEYQASQIIMQAS